VGEGADREGEESLCGMDDGWAYLFAQEPSTARPLIFFLVRTQAQTLTGY
jgi:hypothetical protein